MTGPEPGLDPRTLVPHRPPLLLIGRVIAVDAAGCTTLTRVDPEAWYADAQGAMPGWFGLELMAQSVAAFSGHQRRLDAAAPRDGYLVGTRTYECRVAAFPAGACLEVRVRPQFADPSGLSAFECELRGDGELLAQAVLKVFEPR